MKKLLIAILLLLFSLIYLIVQVTQTTLYLPEFSINVNNPVSLHWSYIGINTGFQKGDSGSIDRISMIPVYLIVLIALILTALSFKRKEK